MLHDILMRHKDLIILYKKCAFKHHLTSVSLHDWVLMGDDIMYCTMQMSRLRKKPLGIFLFMPKED